MAKESEKKKKIPTAKKRDIQNEKRRLQNKMFKSKVRTAVRNFEQAVRKNENVNESLALVYSMMDKGVKRGIFKQNKCSRVKSRLVAKAAQA
ncbi:MAG: 30S ribosomal protein S20 [Waddliaceae bacterium]